MSDNSGPVHCIALRLRKTTHADAYLNVPVTDALLKKVEDGSLKLDFDAFVVEGVRLSRNPAVEWKIEESDTVIHPIQQPVPEGRTSFDVHKQGDVD